MKRMLSISIAGALVALLLAGCAGSQSGSAYSTSQTRGEMHIRMGVVESVRTVIIEGSRGSTVGSILGAVVGGIAGQAVEERANRKEGLEITIKLDNGQMIAVTQEADEAFRAGERVRVLSGSGATRVSH